MVINKELGASTSIIYIITTYACSYLLLRQILAFLKSTTLFNPMVSVQEWESILANWYTYINSHANYNFTSTQNSTCREHLLFFISIGPITWKVSNGYGMVALIRRHTLLESRCVTRLLLVHSILCHSFTIASIQSSITLESLCNMFD